MVRVRPEHRDGLLAIAGLLALAGLSAATVGVGRLLDPFGAVVGLAGAVTIEVAFLRYPERALALWNRRGVPVLGLSVVLVAGVVAVFLLPLLLIAAVWGLVSYLVLLGAVLAGFRNPVGVLLRKVG